MRKSFGNEYEMYKVTHARYAQKCGIQGDYVEDGERPEQEYLTTEIFDRTSDASDITHPDPRDVPGGWGRKEEFGAG